LNPADAVPKLRVCAVSYLNTLPLVWGLLHGPGRDRFQLDFCLPAECADRLATGDADIGIVPSIEADRLGLEIIRGAGIACRGPVRSILLVTKVAPEKIRRLATDSSSRSSAMLSRIILEKRYGARPRVFSMAPDLPSMLAAADAALLIGDPALRLRYEALPMATYDLGGEWLELTGLPMVFAVWARRPAIPADGLAEVFLSSYRFGRERLDDIVRGEAPLRRISEALAREYLTRRIIFELGEPEYEGMRQFVAFSHEFATLVSTGGAIA
jgi:chorismate dehydratase